jgi:quinol monooxygenase YgiN
MIMLTGRFQIDPAKREDFLAFAQAMVGRERSARGNISFDVYEDVTTPNRFLMLEQWESEDILEQHQEGEEFERNEAMLNSYILGEPSWDEYVF